MYNRKANWTDVSVNLRDGDRWWAMGHHPWKVTWVRAESEWLLFVGRSSSSLTSSTRRMRTFLGNLYLYITSVSLRTSKRFFLSLKTLIPLHSISISSSAKSNTAAILFIYVHLYCPKSTPDWLLVELRATLIVTF